MKSLTHINDDIYEKKKHYYLWRKKPLTMNLWLPLLLIFLARHNLLRAPLITFLSFQPPSLLPPPPATLPHKTTHSGALWSDSDRPLFLRENPHNWVVVID